MSPLTRESILAATDLKTQAVEVPEWGGSVFVRVLTGTERDALELKFSSVKAGKRVDNLRGWVVALMACDESGKPLFSEKDAQALGAKNSIALDRVMDAGMALNKVTDQDVKAAVGESDGAQS